jgi:protein-S-isoprenylcysteine O-methyltransferase Ste14
MTGPSKDRATVRVPPPLIFFLILGTGLMLEFLFPFKLYNGFWVGRVVVGGFLMLISGLFAVFALLPMHKRKTPFDPSKPTMKIVKEGAFRFSRNPLYLSLVLLQGGMAVLIFSIWLFMGLPVLFFSLEFLAIRPEEAYLAGKFGREYLDYQASVGRWISFH